MADRKKTVFIFILLTLISTLSATENLILKDFETQDLIMDYSKYVKINWTKKYITATAQIQLPVIRLGNRVSTDNRKIASSLSMAREIAREEAMEEAMGRLMKGIMSLQFDSHTSIYEKMKQDERLKDRMGLVSEYFAIRSRRTGDGRVSVELGISFIGPRGLYSLIVDSYYNSEQVPGILSETYGDKISSIIVDLSEFPDFNPSLEPRIYSDNGRLLFGPEVVSQTCSIKYGLVSWQTNESVAKRKKRAGSRPYYVYAGGILGSKKSDIFLQEKDVNRILANPGGRKAFRRCSVLFVVPNKKSSRKK